MRTLFIAAVALLAGSMTMETTAQNAIAAVVKKCESVKDVDINKVRSRDKNSKELVREVTSITISNNPSLVNEIIAAFEKEKDNALDSSESSANGKITSIFYRFEKGSYSFSQSDGGTAVITVMSGDDFFYSPKVGLSTRAANRIGAGRAQRSVNGKEK